VGALVLLLVIALVWLFRQILTAPVVVACDDSECCCRAGVACSREELT
jgi:hypothetical protein